MKAVDLFCGCGGISAGLEMAGFQVIAGVDIERKYIKSFIKNFPRAKAFCVDLSQISPKEFMHDIGIAKGELSLLAGGPPCQGFSKNVPRKSRSVDSDNNLLINTFLHYCYELSPQMIVMENVAEMKNGFGGEYTKTINNGLATNGYKVTEIVLNSANYGVPQKRKRAFFLATKGGEKEIQQPLKTHSEKHSSDLFGLRPYVTVWDAIGDLPALAHGDAPEFSDYSSKPINYYQKMMRTGVARVKNHHARYLQPTQYERLKSLLPGQGHKDLPPHLQVKSGYSGAYGRLTKDMIAPTITRWVFHPGSGRWGHPVDTRLLSIREVARIQSFPDWFEFVGTYTDQAGQLGNAVPPLLAKAIAEKMVEHYSQTESAESIISINRSKLIFDDSEGMLKEAI